MSTTTPVRERLRAARDQMTSVLVDAEEQVDAAFAALVAGESLLLVSPVPGLAKSLLCESLGRLMSGKFFSQLMSPFTQPEDLFGPLDIPALERGEYVRVTADTLVDAHSALLDEVFKSSPAILNTLLGVLNERRYRHGRTHVRVPLRFFMGASNEYPDPQNGGKELGAFFDRFLVRMKVEPVRDPFSVRRLLWGDDAAAAVGSGKPGPFARNVDRVPRFAETVTPGEVDAASAEAKALPFSRKAVEAVEELLAQLDSKGVLPGNRRRMKAPGLAQAAAYLDGAAQVEPRHLAVTGHALWDDPAQAHDVLAAVLKVSCPENAQAVQAESEARGVVSGLQNDPVSVSDAYAKLTDLESRLSGLKPSPRVKKAADYVAARKADVGNRMLRMTAVKPSGGVP